MIAYIFFLFKYFHTVFMRLGAGNCIGSRQKYFKNCSSISLKLLFLTCQSHFYNFSYNDVTSGFKSRHLTIDLKLNWRALCAADRPALQSSRAAVLSTVWGWSLTDGKNAFCFIVSDSAFMIFLSIFVPYECPARTSLHPTAQLQALSGEHIQPLCFVTQWWNRNF